MTRSLSRRQLLPALAGASLRGQQRPRPNLIFLLTDDQRADSLGAMGNPIIRTPHIDALAAGGVTFTNQFVTTAICMSSRASIFTGQYERTHGIVEFNMQFSEAQFARTYPALLREAGYWTGFIGKWGLDAAPLPASRFDYWRGFAGQGRYLAAGDAGPHLTRVMGDQALEFLEHCPAGRPFFLQVSFKAPHAQDEDPRQFVHDPASAELYAEARIPFPKTAAPQYISQLPLEVQRSEGRRRWAVRFSTPELYERSVKGYYRLITEVDQQVGRIVEKLRARGLAEQTIVLYSSDNGFYLGEHGLADKWIPHEESIRVPLIIYDPRRRATAAGRRRSELTLNIDIAPTILSLAGLAVPASMQGRDLTPLVEGEQPSWRQEFFYEHAFTNAGGWIPRTEGIRDRRWKYIRYLDCRPLFEELYDLAQDPEETTNLAKEARRRGELERLRGRWMRWREHLSRYRVSEPWSEPA